MNPLINSAEELQEYLCSINGLSNFKKERALSDGVIVSTKIRQQYLCSAHQGKIIMSGEVMRVCFDSIGGGCYKVRIERLNGKTFCGNSHD